MTRILLLVPDRTYKTHDFVDAARALGVEVVIGTRERPVLADAMGEGWLGVDLDRPDAGARAVASAALDRPFDAVVGVDDGSTLTAAHASARLGLPHNPVDAVKASLDKARTRELLAQAGLATPGFRTWPADMDPDEVTAARLPVVVKPLNLSGSRGVIRANDPDELAAAFARVAAIVRSPGVCGPGEEPQDILVEDFVPGPEVAVEGLLRGGRLGVLAIFDKPDPLDGPFFEETIYVTPTRLPAGAQREVAETVGRAAAAIGLVEGPIHAEVRLGAAGLFVLEVAARTIGGLCGRTLRFGAGMSLEELVLRHAARLPLPSLEREGRAAGVMMLPIPSRGRLVEVRGQAEARAVPGIEGLVITIPPGGDVVPLPEGDRYLGFMFARTDTPAAAEAALRAAHERLEVVIA
jgi:biotin carboxylase